VALSIWRRREGQKLLSVLNPAQFLAVAIIIVTIDLATFAGWAQALWRRPPIAAHQETTGEIDL
jgi:hypothetical protein